MILLFAFSIHETERELRDEMQARDWVQSDFKVSMKLDIFLN